MIVSTAVIRLHHNRVQVFGSEVGIEIELSIIQLWVFVLFHLLLLYLLLITLLVRIPFFFALAIIICTFWVELDLVLYFAILHDWSETNTSHVGIVSSFMIMWQQVSALIISKLIFRVKSVAETILELVFISALLIDLSKPWLTEHLTVERKYLCIINIWETVIPHFAESFIGIRQLSDELIVKVNDVVNHVVADYWFFTFNQRFHNQREAHLLLENILLSHYSLLIFTVFSLFICLDGCLTLGLGFLLFLLSKWRPFQLSSSEHMNKQILHTLSSVFAFVEDYTVAFFKLWLFGYFLSSQ